MVLTYLHFQNFRILKFPLTIWLGDSSSTSYDLRYHSGGVPIAISSWWILLRHSTARRMEASRGQSWWSLKIIDLDKYHLEYLITWISSPGYTIWTQIYPDYNLVSENCHILRSWDEASHADDTLNPFTMLPVTVRSLYDLPRSIDKERFEMVLSW